MLPMGTEELTAYIMNRLCRDCLDTAWVSVGPVDCSCQHEA
jgi:hypothetical protein